MVADSRGLHDNMQQKRGLDFSTYSLLMRTQALETWLYSRKVTSECQENSRLCQLRHGPNSGKVYGYNNASKDRADFCVLVVYSMHWRFPRSRARVHLISSSEVSHRILPTSRHNFIQEHTHISSIALPSTFLRTGDLPLQGRQSIDTVPRPRCPPILNRNVGSERMVMQKSLAPHT